MTQPYLSNMEKITLMFLRTPFPAPLKSPLNYIGGKGKLIEDLRFNMPTEIGSFIDLFAGGLNVSLNIRAEKYFANDNLYFITDFYKYLQQHSLNQILLEVNEVIKEYNLSKTCPTGYLKLRTDFNSSKVKSPTHFFCLVCFSFNHQIRFNSKHEFNMPFGQDRSSYNNTIKKNLVSMIKYIKERDFHFSSLDYRDFDLTKFGVGDYLYCDPPYLITTATYNDGKRGFTGWGSDEERTLYSIMDKFHAKGGFFGLSNVIRNDKGENKVLKEWSSKYRVIDLSHDSYRNYQRKESSPSSEVLVVNYLEVDDGFEIMQVD